MHKAFGATVALKDVDFILHRGETGPAIAMVITGAFVPVINTVSSQGDVRIATIKKNLTGPKTAA